MYPNLEKQCSKSDVSHLFSRSRASNGRIPREFVNWIKGSLTVRLFQTKVEFLEKFCPRQQSCPGQVASSKKVEFLKNKFCPRRRSWPGHMASSQKNIEFPGKVLPQAAKLPGQVASSKQKSISCKKFCPRQRSCPGHVASY